jgi:hypothetical protein
MTRDHINMLLNVAITASNTQVWTITQEQLERFAALVAAAEREKVAKWMIERGYATGHGDTIEDLLKELEWQVMEREQEACALIAESYEPTCESCPSGVANAIRARGET